VRSVGNISFTTTDHTNIRNTLKQDGHDGPVAIILVAEKGTLFNKEGRIEVQKCWSLMLPLRYGNTLLTSKGEHLKCILFQQDVPVNNC